MKQIIVDAKSGKAVEIDMPAEEAADFTASQRPAAEDRPARITPYRVVRLVEEAGLLDAAQQVLEANLAFKWRFTTTPAIAIDDPDLIAGLRVIGFDTSKLAEHADVW